MVGKDQEGRAQKDLDKTRIERDEQDRQNLVATIHSMVNPFKYKGDNFISFSSGCIAPKDNRDYLITTCSIGQNGANTFIEDRITSETDKICNLIKTNKLKTFSTVEKTAIARIISDGTPCKTVKAKLMHELKKDVKPLAQVPVGSALIVHSPNPHHALYIW